MCTQMGTYLSFSLFHLAYFVPLQNSFVKEHFLQVCYDYKTCKPLSFQSSGPEIYFRRLDYVNDLNKILCFVDQESSIDSRDHDQIFL